MVSTWKMFYQHGKTPREQNGTTRIEWYLKGRSQSFASPHFVLSMSSTRASNSQKPSYFNVSTINSYAWYLKAIPSKFSCATFQETFKILLIL
jgi:hypothetical protein